MSLLQDFGKTWENAGTTQLLKTRICDLNLNIESTDLVTPINQLYAELRRKNLQHLKPDIYLGDEWFSPADTAAISVPFYLAHPRLKELERGFMVEVEGESHTWCMKLLRHEMGHCFDHINQLSHKKEWRHLFGDPDKKTYSPESYAFRPYSKKFVRHLPDHYAQSHPYEDFAESFAVWLDPNSNWQIRYRNQIQVLEKLQYIDRLAKSCARSTKSTRKSCARISQASRMRMTLGRYYEKRKKEAGPNHPAAPDADLRKLFNGANEPNGRTKPKNQKAFIWLTNNTEPLVKSGSLKMGCHKYKVRKLLGQFKSRAKFLNLSLGENEKKTNQDLGGLLEKYLRN